MTTATGATIASEQGKDSNLAALIFDLFKKPALRDFALIVALIAINLYCFQRTLNGYFLADDFVHVPYLVKVFHGHPELLLQNFYSNWVQAQGTQFYRPFISLTLAFDYALWKANPVGYHITNFLYQVAATVLLFLCARRFFYYKNQLEANTVAFLAGAFFAACPLHPEVVSWIIARVDSVQATFLLASLWLYLRAREQVNFGVTKTLSLCCFVIALFSKEMAITLPSTIFLYELIKTDKESGLAARLKLALKQTWQYWLILAVYMGIRTVSLGTISGGYAGSIGQGLSSSLFKRWFQDGAFNRILLPLNADLAASAQRHVKFLKLLYEIAAALVVARAVLLFQEGSLSVYARRILFACSWFAIAMLPTYQVFNLSETLQGSRFIYLGTAPLALLLALLVAPIQFENRAKIKCATNWASGLLSVILVWTLMQLTYQNNNAWAQASRGVRGFQQAVAQWFGANGKASQAHEKNLVIMNIPQRYAGAHMIYNAATLSVLLRPPLTKVDVSKKVFTFEPIEFGDSELINISRLRRMIAHSDQYDFAKWDAESRKLVPLHLESAEIAKTIPGSELTDSRTAGMESYLVSPPINAPAPSIDFVNVDLTSDTPAKKSDVITMSAWNTVANPNFEDDRMIAMPIDNTAHVQFAVSEHKSWVSSETIHELKMGLPNGIGIKKITLTDASTSIPTLSA